LPLIADTLLSPRHASCYAATPPLLSFRLAFIFMPLAEATIAISAFSRQPASVIADAAYDIAITIYLLSFQR
jgi:hypothetical protein